VGHGPLIDDMENHPKDRHVVAAARKAGAQVIVTQNLKDFVPLPAGVEALSPDDFLCGLLDIDSASMVELLRSQAAALRNPPVPLDRLLAGLAKTVPHFIKRVTAHVG
jgi:hypothetical protein